MAKGVLSPVTQKIRKDYGTLVCFCNKNNLNVATFKQVIGGHHRSRPVEKLLIEKGYIKSADEILKEDFLKKEKDMQVKKSNKIASLKEQIAKLEKAA
jgi:hypothetical protein